MQALELFRDISQRKVAIGLVEMADSSSVDGSIISGGDLIQSGRLGLF